MKDELASAKVSKDAGDKKIAELEKKITELQAELASAKTKVNACKCEELQAKVDACKCKEHETTIDELEALLAKARDDLDAEKGKKPDPPLHTWVVQHWKRVFNLGLLTGVGGWLFGLWCNSSDDVADEEMNWIPFAAAALGGTVAGVGVTKLCCAPAVVKPDSSEKVTDRSLVDIVTKPEDSKSDKRVLFLLFIILVLGAFLIYHLCKTDENAIIGRVHDHMAALEAGIPVRRNVDHDGFLKFKNFKNRMQQRNIYMR